MMDLWVHGPHPTGYTSSVFISMGNQSHTYTPHVKSNDGVHQSTADHLYSIARKKVVRPIL